MRTTSRERFRRFLPYWTDQGGLTFAVFNVHDSDVRHARTRIISEFGKDEWENSVKPFMTTGIMEIFNHPPTRILKRFAWYCAFSTERRIARDERIRAAAAAKKAKRNDCPDCAAGVCDYRDGVHIGPIYEWPQKAKREENGNV